MEKRYTASVIVGGESKTLFADSDCESVKKFARLAAECIEDKAPLELRIRVTVYSHTSEVTETSEFIRSLQEWTEWVDFIG